MNESKKPPPDQAQKFKNAAREHEADEDEGRWKERLRRIVRKPTKKEK